MTPVFSPFRLLLVLAGVTLFAQEGVLADPAVRSQVTRLLSERQRQTRAGALLRPAAPAGEERDAVTFLLAAMPLADLQKGAGERFLAAARASLEARRATPWGATLPADLFRHFVLPPRVADEPLDDFRTANYLDLLARVKGLSMAAAALEINNWCLSQADFAPTDLRTGSTRATRNQTYGRCNELSVLTVAALRAVAIPARLVEVPQWAHQDSFHAWVEAWVEGSWRSLGASEPKPTLDQVWILDAARRAPVVRAQVLGPWGTAPRSGLDAAMDLDLTARYGQPRAFQVQVVDAKGAPQAGAQVELRVFNYGALPVVLARNCDAQGRATLQAAGGDLLVWARKGQAFGFCLVNAQAPPESVRITLVGSGQSQDLDFHPLPAQAPIPEFAPGGPGFAARVGESDRLRKATRAAGQDPVRAAALSREAGYGERATDFLRRAGGNMLEIQAFLKENGHAKEQALALLGCLSAKDLLEITREVLLDHLPEPAAGLAALDPEVLTPRVDAEPLEPCRSWLRSRVPAHLAKGARTDPGALVSWFNAQVRVDPACNPARVPMGPRAVLGLGIGDARGRDVTFIALCRALGMPARRNPVLDQPQVRIGSQWRDVQLRTGPTQVLGGVQFQSQPGRQLLLGLQATIARMEDGQPVPLGFDVSLPLSALPSPMGLPAGDYLLVSGVRLRDQAVLARLEFFTVPAGGMVRVPAALRLR